MFPGKTVLFSPPAAQPPASAPANRRARRRQRRSARLATLGAVVAVGLIAAACGSNNAGSATTTTTTTKTSTADAYIAQGLAAQRAGNMGLAVDDYEKVLQVDPTNVYALYDLGDVYQLQGNAAAAEVQYKAALTTDPKFVSALFNLAIIEAKSQSTWAQAAKLYHEVIALAPNTPGAYYNLGGILRGEGHVAQALAQYRKAHQLDSALPIPTKLTGTTKLPGGASGTDRSTTTT